MDAEDEARREPYLGVVKVYMLGDAASMMRLFDKEEGYYTMGSF